MSTRLGTSDWGIMWVRVGQGGLGGYISIGGGEGSKGMLAGDWHQTGACCARAGWVTGRDGIVGMTWGGGGK